MRVVDAGKVHWACKGRCDWVDEASEVQHVCTLGSLVLRFDDMAAATMAGRLVVGLNSLATFCASLTLVHLPTQTFVLREACSHCQQTIATTSDKHFLSLRRLLGLQPGSSIPSWCYSTSGLLPTPSIGADPELPASALQPSYSYTTDLACTQSVQVMVACASSCDSKGTLKSQ